jgi:hypothetical protein
MGIRKSVGKNKKSSRPTESARVEREGTVRKGNRAPKRTKRAPR